MSIPRENRPINSVKKENLDSDATLHKRNLAGISENRLLVQIRRLSQALIASMTVNVVLIVAFFYWVAHERPPIPYYELKPANKQHQEVPLADERSNVQVIQELKILPFDQLVAKLENKQLVENGYAQRDLALACLVNFHHFDIAKALLAFPITPQQQRLLTDERGKALLAYPNLSEEQYRSLIQFANTERWPLTAEGLFLRLQDSSTGDLDSTLVESFFLTKEFAAVDMMFARADSVIEKTEILALLKEGSWVMLSQFAEQQRSSQDLSPARRQRFLLDYIDKKSRIAAFILLKTDPLVAAKKLDDNHILTMLEVLQDKRPEVKTFALELLASPRSDEVRAAAAQRLYAMAGEPFPKSYSHTSALAHFAPHKLTTASTKTKSPQKIATVPEKAKPKVQSTPQTQTKGLVVTSQKVKETKVSQPKPPIKHYVVQQGDTLWKISKRFHVEVGVLKAYNRLQSNDLKPGTTLKIP